MVRALDRKLLRDIRRMGGQVIAIALVIAAAVSTQVLARGVYRSLAETRDAYYATGHFGDVFAQMVRAPRSVVTQAAALPGIVRAEGRVEEYARLTLPGSTGPVRPLINGIESGGRSGLNRLTVLQGMAPAANRSGEVVIDKAFAAATGLKPGDSLQAIIRGKRVALTVAGVGLAPDYVWAIAPGEIMPDPARFGIMWMERRQLESLADRVGAIDALSVQLTPRASESEVIRRLDLLLRPYGGSGAYGRADHPSHQFLDSELMQLDAMARVIPPIFLLVSVFLVYSVLGRMIEKERHEIGLLKAFGYSDLDIAGHYLRFALLTAVIGIVIGGLAGAWMGQAMTRLYGDYYRFPDLHYSVATDVYAWAAGLAAGSAAIGAVAGVRGVLRLSPAVAMAPPMPPAYRGGWLAKLGERAGVTPVGAMVIRHLARWPARLAITVTGVALAQGLLFSTLQFIDASRVMLDAFFGDAQRQDLTVSLVEPLGDGVLFELASLPGVISAEPGRAIMARLGRDGRVERVALEASPSDATLVSRVDRSGAIVPVPPEGLMLSGLLARKLEVSAGETIAVEMLGGRGTRLALPVTATIDELVGTRAYASSDVVDRLARDGAIASFVLLRIDPARRDQIIAALDEMPGVLAVAERAQARRLFEEMINRNLVTMIAFYITFAGTIVVGVVYNNARILFSERAHELATLRVLGYRRREVAGVLAGELGLLVLAALPLGCLVGFWLAQLMTAMFSSDLFRLPFAPARTSYGFAALAIVAAALLAAVPVVVRVRMLDMVRVLKARE